MSEHCSVTKLLIPALLLGCGWTLNPADGKNTFSMLKKVICQFSVDLLRCMLSMFCAECAQSIFLMCHLFRKCAIKLIFLINVAEEMG